MTLEYKYEMFSKIQPTRDGNIRITIQIMRYDAGIMIPPSYLNMKPVVAISEFTTKPTARELKKGVTLDQRFDELFADMTRIAELRIEEEKKNDDIQGYYERRTEKLMRKCPV